MGHPERRPLDAPALHVSEAELVQDLASILERVRAGVDVVIERNRQPLAVIRSSEPVRRRLSECIEMLPAESDATIDAEFAHDVEAAIAAHREALDPAWD